MQKKTVILLLISVVTIASCVKKIPYAPDADTHGNTAPTAITKELNAKVLEELPFSDQQSFVECQKGLIASDTDLRVIDSEGTVVWKAVYYIVKIFLVIYDFLRIHQHSESEKSSSFISLWEQGNAKV